MWYISFTLFFWNFLILHKAFLNRLLLLNPYRENGLGLVSHLYPGFLVHNFPSSESHRSFSVQAPRFPEMLGVLEKYHEIGASYKNAPARGCSILLGLDVGDTFPVNGADPINFGKGWLFPFSPFGRFRTWQLMPDISFLVRHTGYSTIRVPLGFSDIFHLMFPYSYMERCQS